MPFLVKHPFVSEQPDGEDTSVVRPSDWNANHIVIGGVADDEIYISDNTNNNATTSYHGFLPKLSGDSNTYLNGVGNWATPPTDGVWTVDSANAKFEGNVSVNGEFSNFPLKVYGSYQSFYGYVGVNITANASESGIQIENTNTNGRAWTIISTSETSSVGSGKFIIADGTAEQTRFTINQAGLIGIQTQSPNSQLDIQVPDGENVGVRITGDPAGQLADMQQWLDAHNEVTLGSLSAKGTFYSPTKAARYALNNVVDGAIIIDCESGDHQVLLLDQDTALSFNNVIVGQRITLLILQDGIGNHSIGWMANILNPVPDIDRQSNSSTIIEFIAYEPNVLYCLTPINPSIKVARVYVSSADFMEQTALLIPAPGAFKYIVPAGPITYEYLPGSNPYQGVGECNFILRIGNVDAYLGGPTDVLGDMDYCAVVHTPTVVGGVLDPNSVSNSEMTLRATFTLQTGGVGTVSIVDAGTGYGVGDTGLLIGGSSDATYTITGIDVGGVVTGVTISAPGNNYQANQVNAFPGGVQPGSGTGLIFHIDTLVNLGDGNFWINIPYYVAQQYD